MASREVESCRQAIAYGEALRAALSTRVSSSDLPETILRKCLGKGWNYAGSVALQPRHAIISGDDDEVDLTVDELKLIGAWLASLHPDARPEMTRQTTYFWDPPGD